MIRINFIIMQREKIKHLILGILLWGGEYAFQRTRYADVQNYRPLSEVDNDRPSHSLGSSGNLFNGIKALILLHCFSRSNQLPG